MAIKQNIGRFVLSTTILSFIVYIYIFELTPIKIISYENKNQHHSISSGYANQDNCLHTQKSRQERIQQYCSQNPVINEKMEMAIITTEETKRLAYCHVPKVASTLWMLTFAEMNHMEDNLTMYLHNHLALHGVIFSDFSFEVRSEKEINDINTSKLFKFVFIRHPFERLVSAYHDKFEYTKQAEMMVPYFQHQIIKYMFKSLRKPKPTQMKTRARNPLDIDMSFENFINFVLEEASYSKISEPSKHWWPYSDLCKMCKIEFDFIGEIESLQTDVRCILKHFKSYTLLQKMLDRIKKKINDAGGTHTKNMTLEYFSKLSKETIQKLYYFYKVDFDLGRYAFPKEYLDRGIS